MKGRQSSPAVRRSSPQGLAERRGTDGRQAPTVPYRRLLAGHPLVSWPAWGHGQHVQEARAHVSAQIEAGPVGRDTTSPRARQVRPHRRPRQPLELDEVAHPALTLTGCRVTGRERCDGPQSGAAATPRSSAGAASSRRSRVGWCHRDIPMLRYQRLRSSLSASSGNLDETVTLIDTGRRAERRTYASVPLGLRGERQ